MDSFDHRLAVIFVESSPNQGPLVKSSALSDGLPSLRVAPQAAREDQIKFEASMAEVLPQAQALAPAKIAQIVVIGLSKGSLPMPYQIKIAHGAI